MSAATRKWTRALLRRALEDETLLDELRRSFSDDITEEQIRRRIRDKLAWQPWMPGDPYHCNDCESPVDDTTGEVLVVGRPGRPDRLWYRAVCQRCREAKSKRSDAGWES